MTSQHAPSSELIKAKQLLDTEELLSAELLLRHIQNTHPEHADVYLGLSQVYVKQQRWSESIQMLRKARTLLGPVPDVQWSLFQLELSHGCAARALEVAKTTLESSNNNRPNALVAAFVQSLFNSRRETQLNALLRVIEFDSAQGYQSLANELQRYPNGLPMSICILEKLVRRFPDSLSSWHQLAQLQAKNYDYPAAIAAFDHLVRQSPSSATLYAAFADLYLLAENTAQGRRWVKKALDLASNLTSGHEIKLRLDYFSGRQDTQQAERLLELSPHNGYGWRALVDSLEDKDLVSAVERLDVALQDVKDLFHSKLIRYVQGKALTRLRRYDRAFQAYQTANELQQRTLQNIGRVYNSEQLRQQFTQLQQLKLSPVASTKVSEPEFRPIFIVGLPRSGTTLLDKILQQHSDVESLGESMQIEKQIRRLCFDIDHESIPETLSAKQVRLIGEAYKESLPKNHAGVITDKMPHNFRFVNIIMSVFPDAKVLQLRRELKANAWSIYTQPFTDTHNYAVDLQHIADFYHQGHQLMDIWRQSYPDSVMDVSYEELVSNPVEKLESVFEFCKLKWAPAFLNFHQHASPSFTFSEHQVRQPINKKSLSAWQPFAPYLKALEK